MVFDSNPGLKNAILRGTKRRRWMLAAQFTWFTLFVLLLLVCIASLCLVILVLVGIASSLSSPPSGLAGFLRCAVQMVAILALVAAIIGLRHLGHRIVVMAVAKWRCFNNLRRWCEAEVNSRLEQLLERHEPFALYLRSFSIEIQEYAEDMIPYSGPQYPYELPGREELRLRISDQRCEDTAVVKALCKYLTVVALANPNDPTPPVGLITIYGAKPDWFEIFTAMADRASAIAALQLKNTPGLSREMEYIDRQNLRMRTAVLRSGGNPSPIIDDLMARLRINAQEPEVNSER